jgi:hypothetical protein
MIKLLLPLAKGNTEPSYYLKKKAKRTYGKLTLVTDSLLHRTRDGLPIVAKLSYQGLRLEREYHVAQRLYRFSEAHQLLSLPLEKVTLPHGLIAIIFKYDGK